MPTLDHTGWTAPTVDGSTDTWGAALNTLLEKLDGRIGGVTELGQVSGTVDIDLSGDDRVFTLTSTDNVTFTFTSPLASGSVDTFRIAMLADGTNTVTYPGAVDWPGGTAPTAPADGEFDVLEFTTVDGGATWYGWQVIDDGRG